MPYFPQVLKFALYLALSSSLVSGFSFTFTSQPQQCSNLSLQITGSGTPPYSVLIIPYGPTPLPNNIEARTIVYQEFSGDSSSVSFQLKYPTNSQFVAVVSDSTGFGTGGTSVAASVMGTSDSSCYNATQNVSPAFPFNISPPNQLVQCSASRLWWNSDQVQGTPNFQGVIPGGQSFSIPVGQVTQVADEGSGFNWTPAVRAGSTLMIVAGDNRGLGTGGSEPYNVQAGLNPNSSCLTNNSPSSTAGAPAGGAYPTNSSGDETGSSTPHPHSSHLTCTSGGVIGGLAAIAILALAGFYIIRRKTSPRSQKERPVDLLQGDPDDNEPPPNTELPQYYQPEPFLATAPTEVSSAYAQEDGGRRSFVSGSNLLHDSLPASRYGTSDRRQSGLTTFSDPRSATPELDGTGAPSGSMTGLTSSRKSPMPRQLRPVNIIQHEDAGLSNPEDGEQAETIELPPAYTNIRKTLEQS
ncbi:hypothetical protein PAXINDRAFT_76738 [Paxillus involutus ATCC 200175]|uniref:Uncharacterized protein n=1 Tax=Paxillus involutus ATCC 200175 TaxID=664439 RepID=A0A0C9TJP9_PAXIN|nr:hypothetical protein PAXINDRAFT_76738 [Paxillus involutus ATCC 200175]